MGIFNKLFSNKTKTDNPDNTKLLGLLDKYWKENGAEDTYKNVVMELMNGNSFLMFPTHNDTNTEPDKWTTVKKETTMNLTSIVYVDGLKVFGVFTDEHALLAWTKKPTQYTAMHAQDVLKFAQDNKVDRIVINSDQPNMFVLERSRENIKHYTIEQDTKVLLGTPNKPLNNSLTSRLIENFRKNDTISEVYQYGQTKENEFSIVLGFKLTSYSDDAKKAAVNSVQNALQSETLDQPLDLIFIETEDWYNKIKKVERSLLYKK